MHYSLRNCMQMAKILAYEKNIFINLTKNIPCQQCKHSANGQMCSKLTEHSALKKSAVNTESNNIQ